MIQKLLLPSLYETLYMVGVSTLLAVIGGCIIGVLVVITRPGGISEHSLVYKLCSMLIDAFRSVPFIILMIFIFPFTKFIVGAKIGINASIVPLVVAAIPFFARLTESALLEVSPGVIEAARSMGATTSEIVWKVYLPEAKPALIRAVTNLCINLIGYSAMAGAVGGGGLGDLALRYGYQRYEPELMLVIVIILIVLVNIIQTIGTYAARKFERK